MNSKYHTRKQYENYYLRLLNGNKLDKERVKKMTDYELLSALHVLLIENGCIGLTTDELEMELP